MEILKRRLELRLLRWKLSNGRIACDPDILPADLNWIEMELASL